MMNVSFDVPVGKARHFDSIRDSDRSILMPAQCPIVGRRFVEQNCPHRTSVRADDRSRQATSDTLVQKPVQCFQTSQPHPWTVIANGFGELSQSLLFAWMQGGFNANRSDLIEPGKIRST